MSRALEWASGAAAITPIERLVLVLLATHADEQGQGVLPDDQAIADFILCDDADQVPVWLAVVAEAHLSVTINADRTFVLGLPC